jgi:hypothetical protein
MVTQVGVLLRLRIHSGILSLHRSYQKMYHVVSHAHDATTSLRIERDGENGIEQPHAFL